MTHAHRAELLTMGDFVPRVHLAMSRHVLVVKTRVLLDSGRPGMMLNILEGQPPSTDT